MFPKSGAPVETDVIPELYLEYLSEPPVKEPSLQVPLVESPRREMYLS
jgi:hypothetical protein